MKSSPSVSQLDAPKEEPPVEVAPEATVAPKEETSALKATGTFIGAV